jgi:FkbM family methyltransferase
MRVFANSPISHFLAVEPVPTFLAQLHQRYANIAGVEIMDVALSNRPEQKREMFEISGGGRMYRNYRGTPIVTSGSEKPGGKTTVAHEVRVTTGDDIFLNRSFKPFLLKIDCDGHDGHILEGLRQTLSRHRVLVQFEYCDFWIGAGSRLGPIYSLLSGAGYNVYKMFPDRLIRFRYNPVFETYGYQNIVAVPQEFKSISGKIISISST